MPDENKLRLMKEHGVRIVETCPTCEHSIFIGQWGYCKPWNYKHKKHGGERQKPAHVSMTCDKYIEAADVEKKSELGDYLAVLRSWITGTMEGATQ